MLYVILSCDILFLHALGVTVCNVQPVKQMCIRDRALTLKGWFLKGCSSDNGISRTFSSLASWRLSSVENTSSYGASSTFFALLLSKTGNRGRVRKGGLIMQSLLIEKIGVCLCCLFLGCCRCPVGFQLMAAYPHF